MQIKCVAIDDEPLALDVIREYSQHFPTLKMVQTFDDAISGAEYLRNNPIDLLFIDINLPDISGIELSEGHFEKRVQLQTKSGGCATIEANVLPQSVTNYLEASYPNYVFKRAFALASNGTLQGYVVVIDANNSKYALQFSATGNFETVKTIW